MASEFRRYFYDKIQGEFDSLRQHGIDKAELLTELSIKYGIRKETIRANIDIYRMDHAAHEYIKSLINTRLHAPAPSFLAKADSFSK